MNIKLDSKYLLNYVEEGDLTQYKERLKKSNIRS